jgi:hypothetical protein
VFEVRFFTGRDTNGRPTQCSKTVRGTKRDARRIAAQLESRRPSNGAGRTVAAVLDAWWQAFTISATGRRPRRSVTVTTSGPWRAPRPREPRHDAGRFSTSLNRTTSCTPSSLNATSSPVVQSLMRTLPYLVISNGPADVDLALPIDLRIRPLAYSATLCSVGPSPRDTGGPPPCLSPRTHRVRLLRVAQIMVRVGHMARDGVGA